MTHEKCRGGSGKRPKNLQQSDTPFCQDYLRRFVAKLAAHLPIFSRYVPSLPGLKRSLSNLSVTLGTAHSLTYLLTQKTAIL